MLTNVLTEWTLDFHWFLQIARRTLSQFIGSYHSDQVFVAFHELTDSLSQGIATNGAGTAPRRTSRVAFLQQILCDGRSAVVFWCLPRYCHIVPLNVRYGEVTWRAWFVWKRSDVGNSSIGSVHTESEKNQKLTVEISFQAKSRCVDTM